MFCRTTMGPGARDSRGLASRRWVKGGLPQAWQGRGDESRQWRALKAPVASLPCVPSPARGRGVPTPILVLKDIRRQPWVSPACGAPPAPGTPLTAPPGAKGATAALDPPTAGRRRPQPGALCGDTRCRTAEPLEGCLGSLLSPGRASAPGITYHEHLQIRSLCWVLY